MSTKSLNLFRRGRLSYAVALLASASAIPAVYGQVPEQPTLEEVIVTGSRLQRDPNMTSAQPVQTIDAETIGNSAVTDLADLLTENPALMASSISSNNSSTGNTGRSGNVGGSALNLRSLGSNRTLTLVNGRRHVSGIEGTSSVDVTTIPSGLIERVEVLTGGASAVYGADAVTGVVNFVLKDNFEGAEFSARGGMSGEGDGENYGVEALFGRNFDEGRGNVTVAVQHDYFSGLKADERDRLAQGGNWSSGANPMRRFQQGDIDPATMPNLARFYDYQNTRRFPWGSPIPNNTTFGNQFRTAFGSAPNLTPAELALLDRPNQVTPLTLAPGFTYNITSPYGVVGYGGITSGAAGLDTSPDLDGNGVADCLQSWTGFNSPAFGGGGCWYVDATGNLIPYQDGLVIDGDNQYDAVQSYRGVVNPSYLMPEDQKVSINLTSSYALSDNMRLFGEAKYVRHEVTSGGGVLFSTDLLYSAPDNPFIPAALQSYASAPTRGWYGPGLYTSRDSEDYGSAKRENKRDTYRFVAGLAGSIDQWELDYEISANYGEFRRTAIEHDTVIIDRFFASLDVVTDPATGQPVCRSDIDSNAYAPTSPWNFPRYLGRTARTPAFTFAPGDGQCVPANIFGGHGGMDAAAEFFTYDRPVREEITQSVVGGFVSGTSSPWFELPAGPIAFATGFEWREETSKQNWHEYDQGIIQVSGVTQYGVAYQPGDWVGDVTANSGYADSAKSLGSSPSNLLSNGSGQYDVLDFYAETSVPLLSGVLLVEELTLDAAVRSSDYSTFGESTTWGAGLVWMPIDDIRLRYSINEAVRVPNIYEMFAPIQGATFSPRDPCSVENIAAAPSPGTRQANCVTALQSLNVPANGGGNPIFDESGNYSWINPLTAGFSGETGGNLNLEPETGTTETYGVVLQPRFLPGLSLTVDYWDIEIEGSIETIAAQDIVNGCYDAATLNNPFCALLRRQNDASHPQVGGFTYLLQGLANMSSVKARGIDASVGYSMDLGELRLGFNGTVTKLKQHDVIEPANPGQVARVNVGLGELNQPEWGGQFSLNAGFRDFSLNWRTRWQGEQVMTGQIETAMQNYGDLVFSDDFYSHNLSGRYDYSDSMSIFGGIGNVTNEEPYMTSASTPVTQIGRSYYVGVDMRF